jgi:DEAD/DEAH box helicase domain-containing protein
MLKKIVLDLETQKSFQDVGGRGKNHLLKVSVLQTADQIIGYNIKDFDFEVIQPYLNFNIMEVPYLDLLAEIEKVLHHRIKLDIVAQGTLGTGKSGNGLEAILYYQNGRMDLLKKYCLDDVKITKQVYDYVLKNEKLLYKDFFKTKEIALKIADAVPRVGVRHQPALF